LHRPWTCKELNCRLMYNCFKPFSSNTDKHLFRRDSVNCGMKESAFDCRLPCSTNVAIRFSTCKKYDIRFGTSFANFPKWGSCYARNGKNSSHLRIQSLVNLDFFFLLLILLILIFFKLSIFIL
jgi:hypothetical protein